jgi:threonylcarbamoyladenosine tRNA methylthiotransferase MtaB
VRCLPLVVYKVAFETFGCRLNQAETATLYRQFMAKGYEVVDDPADADLYVVNTCTLTAQATSKCRRVIRSVIRRNPAACVAAIGCYSQTDAETLRTIDGLDYIIGTADKLRLADIIPAPVKTPSAVVVQTPVGGEAFTIDEAGYYPSTTRANIKVQEGCDFVCAFCIIPRSRGRARSRVFADIVAEAQSLVAAGHREVVVTGVNMGTYRDGPYRLGDVTRALADLEGLDRVRLSSIEPTTIDEGVVAQMAEGGALCPYLHVPLQSGDDDVLARMRRRYTRGDYHRFMREVLERVPDVGFGTDVMVGFPTEDEAAFENTCEAVRALPFANVHVFSFSARPRTTAFGMEGRVVPAVVRERSAAMHRLAESKKAEFYGTQQGRRVRVLFEEEDGGGSWVGFSDNYVKTAVRAESDLSNALLDVVITGVAASEKGRLVATGEVVGS